MVFLGKRTKYFDECIQLSCGLKHRKMLQDKNKTYFFCLQRRNRTTDPSTNVEAELNKVNSEADYRQFLHEHIQWKTSFLVVNNSNETCAKFLGSKISSNNLQLFPECHEKRDMFEETYCSCNHTVDDEKRNYLLNLSNLFVLLGTISVIGNITVFFIEARALIQKPSIAKEETVCRVLVLNLSTSDLLMGIYLTVFPLSRKFIEGRPIPKLCSFLGIISVLSSEISVTVLVLICLYRWIGIAYPYKVIRLKVLKIVIAVMWINWLIIASLPVLSVDLIGFIFIDGIRFSDTCKSQRDIRFDQALRLFICISNGNSSNAVSHAIPVFKKLANYNSQGLLNTTLSHLGMIKEYDKFHYVGYYSYPRLCTSYVFANTPFSHQYYSLIILFYNFIAFIIILIAYIVIWKKISKSANLNRQSANAQKVTENTKIYRRLFLVIFTDFLCWFPVCVIAFYFYFNDLYGWEEILPDFRDCPKNRKKFFSLISVSVLIPINSVVNPYLYSWFTWKQLLKKCKTFCARRE